MKVQVQESVPSDVANKFAGQPFAQIIRISPQSMP